MSQVDYEVHMTRVLHAARISNVDSVTFVNRIREMVSSELGKEIEKDVLSRHERGKKKNILILHEETWRLRIFSLAHARDKT